ncbi:MAG: DUF1836 domain-containing protein, partial [Blautia sp.]|nr:DUF1836 domain-containing protein [Blautia sp.]
MTDNEKIMMTMILDTLSGLDHIHPEDIPDIDLYMDQVTTYMETQLAQSKRYPDDKILTKTMINNYAKNDLLPSPEKKRYSKEHLLLLIFIYYFKNFLSISDIKTLLDPITEKYYKADTDQDMTYIYDEVFSMEKGQIERLEKELIKQYRVAASTFQDAGEEEREKLIRFSFICLLSFDVYVKKMMVERMIDEMRPAEPPKKEKKSKK